MYPTWHDVFDNNDILCLCTVDMHEKEKPSYLVEVESYKIPDELVSVYQVESIAETET